MRVQVDSSAAISRQRDMDCKHVQQDSGPCSKHAVHVNVNFAPRAFMISCVRSSQGVQNLSRKPFPLTITINMFFPNPKSPNTKLGLASAENFRCCLEDTVQPARDHTKLSLNQYKTTQLLDCSKSHCSTNVPSSAKLLVLVGIRKSAQQSVIRNPMPKH